MKTGEVARDFADLLERHYGRDPPAGSVLEVLGIMATVVLASMEIEPGQRTRDRFIKKLVAETDRLWRH